MSRFVKNVLKLGSATAIAQLLGILITPVITRLYSPADFGIYQIFISIVLIIGAISCLSYHSSILLPDTDRDAAHIVVLCFLLVICISIVAGLLIWCLSDWLEEALNVPGFSGYIILIPIGIFFNGCVFVIISWLSRRVRFGSIAVSRVASSILNKSVQIGMGLVYASPLGLITGSLVNDVSTSAVMLTSCKNDGKFFKNISISEIKALALKYRQFPVFSSGSTLAEVGYNNFSSFMLAFFFNPVVVGYYSLAYTVVKMPIKLVGSAVYSVFYQKASEERKKTGGLHNIVKNVHRRLISIGLFPFLVLIVIGEDLFSIVFGQEWYTAGLYIKILAPWMFILFISEPMISIFNVTEKLRMNFIFNGAILLSGIIAMCVGGIIGDPVITLLLFSITGIIFHGLRYHYVLKIVGANIKESILDFLRYLLIGLVIVIPLFVWKYFFQDPIILIGLAVVLTGIYYLIIIFNDKMLKEECIQFLKIIRRN